VAEYQLNAMPGTGEFVETPTFPPELYDKVQDIDYAKKVAPVEREPIAVEANTNGSSSQEANDSFGKTTPRGYCAEQVFNKSLGAYQRPLSTHGVRNQQDSTFSLAGGYNAMENRGKRSAVKVNAPPGGGGSNFW